jgi:hypothetical protein
MIMRFRPANISLINRRLYLPRLLLTLSSFEKKKDQRTLTGHYISISGLAVDGLAVIHLQPTDTRFKALENPSKGELAIYRSPRAGLLDGGPLSEHITR